MISHRQQRGGHRGVGHHLLTPPPRLVLVRDPDTADQLRLADIQRRHPGNDLPILWIFLQHYALPLSSQPTTGGCPQELPGLRRI
jgi:hypothetical protein